VRAPIVRRLGVWACFSMEGALTMASGYLLTLLLAARELERRPTLEPAGQGEHAGPRLVVLIPAHDEQDGIQATLASLAACSYPADRWRTVVIADNCADRTADRAREAGVEVWEREDPAHRSKGFALAWALRRLQSAGEQFDAVVMLDADCLVSPNLLSAIGARMGHGARAVQVDYAVSNPGASNASALRFAGFALTNTIRPLGKQRLGLSCGLFGTGMAFSWELLSRIPWRAVGLAEDGEYHMRLVLAGERVEFVPDAWVSSAMPSSFAAGSSQQARWENGKLQLARGWSPRLISAGLARADLVRLHAGIECLVPPQSLIAAGSLGSGLAGLLLGSRRLIWLSIVTLGAQVAFVLGGLRLLRAPAAVYRALVIAPALILRKVALYAGLLVGRGPTSWVRTERETPRPCK
jgi:1,2-diacylglycerol 3-beta-glucosyltransferase